MGVLCPKKEGGKNGKLSKREFPRRGLWGGEVFFLWAKMPMGVDPLQPPLLQ